VGRYARLGSPVLLLYYTQRFKADILNSPYETKGLRSGFFIEPYWIRSNREHRKWPRIYSTLQSLADVWQLHPLSLPPPQNSLHLIILLHLRSLGTELCTMPTEAENMTGRGQRFRRAPTTPRFSAFLWAITLVHKLRRLLECSLPCFELRSPL